MSTSGRSTDHPGADDAAGVLAGRTAVVTGGARGLGHAMAAALAAEGAAVAVLDVQGAAAGAARLAQRSPAPTAGFDVDVTDAGSVSAALASAAEQLGLATVLVNSAGVASTRAALEISPEEFRHVVDVNLTGTFLVAQAFARRVVEAGAEATVVNVASMSGLVVNVPQTQAAYNASKAGVAMLTRSLAVEWLPLGIRVNAISPGYFASEMTREVIDSQPEVARQWTDRTPAGRVGRPEELGDLVVYLASERSRFVVGADIVIDGGYTIV